MEKKILIVDDEKYLLQLYIEAFSEVGYTVRSAESAEKALEILKHENLQVMFLDLKLPGKSGVDLCRQIRKDTPMAVIYAVTGYSSLFEPSDCYEAGFDDYFTKPVDLEILFKAAQDAFEKLDIQKDEKG